jgi:hypothetical protein
VTPDLSGQWWLNLRDSVLSPAIAHAICRASMRIHHHDPRFAVHLNLVFEEQPFDVRFALTTDASNAAPPNPDAPLVTSLCWDGDVLVSAFRERGPFGEVVISFRYSLEDGGRRLRADEKVRGGGRDQDNLWIYNRDGAIASGT